MTDTDNKKADDKQPETKPAVEAKTAAEKEAEAKKTAEAKAAAEANPNQSTKTVQPIDNSKAPPGGPHPSGLKVPDDKPEPETLTDEQLEALIGKDAAEGDTNAGLHEVTDDAMERARGSHEKLQKLVKSFPKGIDRNHTMFGYGGITIHVGDLINLFDPELKDAS